MHTSGRGATWKNRPWRVAAWSTAAPFMLLPIAVQLTHGHFGWSLSDFIYLAMILLFGAAIFDLAARKFPNFAYLVGAGAAVAAGFGLLVVNGAVGLVGVRGRNSQSILLCRRWSRNPRDLPCSRSAGVNGQSNAGSGKRACGRKLSPADRREWSVRRRSAD